MNADQLLSTALILLALGIAVHAIHRDGWRRAFQSPTAFTMLAMAAVNLPGAVDEVTGSAIRRAMLGVACGLLIVAFASAYLNRGAR
jgi:hypothetical protein